MREIKFRGYCERDSEWRYGHYITDGKIHEINTLLQDDKTLYGSQINIDSLGQYTGLKDKNGVDSKEIYDGDILLLPDGIRNGVVVFVNGCYFLKMKDNSLMNLYDVISISRVIRVIGNKYESPELLS